MKKFIACILCASFICIGAFSVAVSAGDGNDSGYLDGVSCLSRCSTGTSTAIPSYYASSEGSTKKDLKIDISYKYSVESSARYDSTGWIYDYGTWLADDSVPVDYIGSTHWVGNKSIYLFSDAR